MRRIIRKRSLGTRDHQKLMALLIIIVLVTSGCTGLIPQGEKMPVPTPTPPPETRPAITPDTLPTRATPPVIAIRNITLTHPRNIKPVSARDYPENTIKALEEVTSPMTADGINGYLRWDSVRARTRGTETARIEKTVREVDSAIAASALREDLVLYHEIRDDSPQQIRDSGRYAEPGYTLCSYDLSILYHAGSPARRDRYGYLTYLVFHEGPGSHLLFVNESTREVLLPRGMTWEMTAEENVTQARFTLDSVPRYKDDDIRHLRLIYMNRIS